MVHAQVKAFLLVLYYTWIFKAWAESLPADVDQVVAFVAVGAIALPWSITGFISTEGLLIAIR